MQTGEKQTELSLLASDMMLNVGNPTESQKKKNPTRTNK